MYFFAECVTLCVFFFSKTANFLLILRANSHCSLVSNRDSPSKPVKMFAKLSDPVCDILNSLALSSQNPGCTL